MAFYWCSIVTLGPVVTIVELQAEKHNPQNQECDEAPYKPLSARQQCSEKINKNLHYIY